MIIACQIILPIVIYIIGIIIFAKGYPITTEKLEEQNKILAERRGQK